MDAVLLKAASVGAKQVSLDGKRLQEVPKALERVQSLQSLNMRNNSIPALPRHLSALTSLTSLNVGCNRLTRLDTCLAALWRLESLHLFQNQITQLNAQVLMSLQNLRVLNLSNNALTTLPPEIQQYAAAHYAHLSCGRLYCVCERMRVVSLSLQCLTHMSVSGNHLELLPAEVGVLGNMLELNLEGNELKRLPSSVGQLGKLRKLFLAKNKLKRLPKTINGCCSLTVLDVSGNAVEYFPAELLQIPLVEFHYEENPLVPFIPVPSDLCQEVLMLRELAGRVALEQLRAGEWTAVASQPVLQSLVEQGGSCASCHGPFVNSWLECVRFVRVREVLAHVVTPADVVPVRAPLCSYQCYDATATQREFYGLASVA